MADEIVGFDGLNFFLIYIYFYWSLSLTVKCVIRFGKFARILENKWN
jgi:hypothetical protein